MAEGIRKLRVLVLDGRAERVEVVTRTFDLLRDHARRTNRKIVAVAESVLASHRLLASRTDPGAHGEAPGPATLDGT